MGYIDKVIVLNLPHRIDRKYYMLGHLHSIGTNPGIIHFFPAKYHADFESPEAIIEAAVADGFPEFQSERYLGWRDVHHGKFEIVCHWNMAAIFREIMQSDVNTLIMIDDVVLKIKFEYLCNIIDFLDNQYSPFYFLQLGYWVNSSADHWMMSHGLVHRAYEEEDIINGFIAKGCGGHGNYATVVSPAGAEILLNNLKSPSGHEPENVMGFWAHPDKDKTGMFHFIENVVEYAPPDFEDDSIN